MSNLLEKASILLTPTAYDDGKILSVKPEPILGSELVTNGDFATDSNWSKDANWSIANGKATSTGVGRMFQSIPFLETNIGTTVQVSFDIIDITANGVVVNCYGGVSQLFTTVGTHTFTTTTINNTNLYFNNGGAGNLIGSIDNVSVKELIDGDFDFTRNSSATRVNSEGLIEDMQILSSNLVTNGDFSQEGSQLVTNGDFATDSDWTKQTSWSISGGAANYDFLSDAKYIRQTLLSGGFVAGKAYKINFEITSGTAYMNVNSNGGGLISLNTYSVGSYSIYVTASASGSDLLIYGRNTSGTAFSIDNVSVKEVGQDWSLGTGWSIGTNKAIANNVPNLQRLQRAGNNPSVIGNTYKYSIDISNVSGAYSLYVFGVYVLASVGTEGVIEGYVTATSTNGAVWVAGATANGLISATITNISVIEITEDTNLPRINYEGFSYQDSLGSEEIVNGTFDENVNGWVTNNANASFVWQINKTALFTSTSFAYVRASPALNLNAAVYKVSFDILSFEGNLSNVHIGLGTTGNVITTTGSYTYFYTSTGGSTEFQIRPNSGGTGSITIDNVSVKEYLGQEVVPDSGCGSWLFEPQSTNLIINSDRGVYGSSPASEILTTAPDGTNTSVRPVPSAGSNRYTGQISGGTYATNTKITYSWYRKRISTPVIDTYVGDLEPNILVNVTQVGSTIQVKSDINGFDRFSATFNISDGSLASNIRLYFGSIIGIGNSSVAYWGHQLEVGSFATSIIPTSGSTVTRLQDAAFGAGSSDLINSTEGVLYAEIAALSDDLTNKQISLNNGTTDDRIQLYYSASSNQISVFYKSQSGATAFILNHTLSDITQFNKVAFKWKQNDFALWSNSVEVATQTSGVTSSANTLTKLDFQQFNGSADFFGKTKCVAVFKEALTDDELECLTSNETSYSSFTALALANNYTII